MVVFLLFHRICQEMHNNHCRSREILGSSTHDLPDILAAPSWSRAGCCCQLAVQRPSNMLVYLRARSAQTKTECNYLNGWIKNGHIRKNLTKKW